MNGPIEWAATPELSMHPIEQLPARGRLLVDTAPIIYLLENHPVFADRYAPLFERAEAGHYELIITTITLAEVLTGPLRTGNETLAERYRTALCESAPFRLIPLSAEVATRAARIRAQTRLKLPDAIQLATALECGCIGLITHDRDFSALAHADEKLAIYG
jgi:predicted nucleic acid-binding protein